MDIKIFASHTPDRDTVCLKHPMIYNVIAGSAFQTKEIRPGVYRDDQGTHISEKNKSYCELTTQYWAWKNMQADYYGFCHYRRLFSFAPKSDRPMEYYDHLDETMLQELHYDEGHIRAWAGQYDFMIVRGVPVEALHAKSVYEQYQNSLELHSRDLDLLLQVIQEKYPGLHPSAKEYLDGQVCYHCNMFLAKRALFQEYSAILFDVLEETEKRMDTRGYSREAYRTIGHLGERMAGIYYLYLKKQGKYRLGELQRAFFRYADAEMEIPQPASKESVAVVLTAQQKDVPVLAVCLRSIMDQASAVHFYEIYILHTNITPESQRLVLDMPAGKNVRILFADVSKCAARYQRQTGICKIAQPYYRFLMLDLLKNYEKAVYLDHDTIVLQDIAQLYQTELGDDLLAAAWDVDFAGQCNKKHTDLKKYSIETLGMADPFAYFQAGVLVCNLAKLRKEVTVWKLLEMADTGGYRFPVPDILNTVCQGRVTCLDLSWNVLADSGGRWKERIKYAPYPMLDAYERARKKPLIVHYAGSLKPWTRAEGDYVHLFWETARKTMFYERLFKNMLLCAAEKKPECANAEIEARHLKYVRKIFMKVLRKDSKIRKKLGKAYWRIFG